jgi:hypothetical protein
LLNSISETVHVEHQLQQARRKTAFDEKGVSDEQQGLLL